MAQSQARVPTERADRYVKQLAEHLGRRNAPVVEADGVRLMLAAGSCLMTPGPEHLVLTATAPDAEALATVEEVVSRHVERIGRRDGLAVSWVRSAG